MWLNGYSSNPVLYLRFMGWGGIALKQNPYLGRRTKVEKREFEIANK